MGFMDKAKQAAEQAQKKLEEAQTKFNEGQQQKGSQGAATENVTYDEHGRPVQQDAPPAGATAPPSADPAAPAADEAPAAKPSKDEPLKEGVNQNPDPFKPIQ